MAPYRCCIGTGKPSGFTRSRAPSSASRRIKKRSVRKTAAWALGNIADERAVPGLTEALLDEDDEVRDAAQKALDTIKNE